VNRLSPLFIVCSATIVIGQVVLGQSQPPPASTPLTPQQALASFRLEPDLAIELVAAEPSVVDPVALCFDEKGRMYVAENRGYPTGPGAGYGPAGTIAMLEDANGDGRFEKRTTFASGLTFPNGVLPWKGGLFVTCAPDVLYLKDTDGDGRADERRVVFTGFATNKSTQLRVCYPTLGPDNWIYLSTGLSGGKVTSPIYTNHPPVDVERDDFRFKPDTDQFEAADGKGQFGLTFDDFGRRFTCMNRVHIQHVVLPSRYLKRNPNLAFSDTMQNVPEATINDLLKGENRAARIYPISANFTTADSHAGTFTAACGILIYRGTALPAEYRGQPFACDPTGNLVHWDKLSSAGATFTARRVREGIEFLASTDNWFRPVFLANGPDGALYICDMYRKTIEHPEYLPEEIRKRTDFDGGKGMGRIYRVVGAKPQAGKRVVSDQLSVVSNRKMDLAKAGVKELCELLSHPNAWQRETAQRLLVERQDRRAVPILESIVASRRTPILSSPAGRFHALLTLEALGPVHDLTLECALSDPLPGVREAGVQLTESRLRQGQDTAKWLERVAATAQDLDARVRFQSALSLGEAAQRTERDDSNPTAPLQAKLPLIDGLAAIALQDAGDRWARAALLSSIYRHDRDLLEALIRRSKPNARNLPELFIELGRIIAAGSPNPGIGSELEATQIGFDSQASFLAGYADGLPNRGPKFTNLSPLELLISASSDGRYAELLRNLIQEAQSILGSATEPANRRLRAIALLAHADAKQAGAALLPLLESQQPSEVQTAAVRALLRPHHPGVAAELLASARWRSFTPSVRNAVLSALLTRQEFLPDVLAAIESDRLAPSLLSNAQRNRFLNHNDPALKKRAEAVFKSMQSGDRMKAYEENKSVLSLRSNARNGSAVFKQHCASCHRLDREGIPVGPDLFGIRNQPKEAILLHVLAPDYEIAPGFAGYVVETKDGRTLSGLILSETPTSITLRQAQGNEENILRSSIAGLSASNSSLMPAGLEKAMTRQDLADLIAYLKGE